MISVPFFDEEPKLGTRMPDFLFSDAGKDKYPYLPVRLLLKDKYESDKKIKNINDQSKRDIKGCLKLCFQFVRLELTPKKINNDFLKSLKPDEIEVAAGSATQKMNLQEGIDKELAKKITTLVKQSKSKVQASVQGDSVRITGKKRDDLQQIIQMVKDQNYPVPLQYDNFRD